jgi:hypothetical protein
LILNVILLYFKTSSIIFILAVSSSFLMLLVEPIGIAHSINKPNVVQNNDPCYVTSSPECKNLQSIQPKNSTDMIH